MINRWRIIMHSWNLYIRRTEVNNSMIKRLRILIQPWTLYISKTEIKKTNDKTLKYYNTLLEFVHKQERD